MNGQCSCVHQGGEMYLKYTYTCNNLKQLVPNFTEQKMLERVLINLAIKPLVSISLRNKIISEKCFWSLNPHKPR